MSSIAEKVQNIIDYYANLLIIQYHNKSKAKSTIESLISELLGDGLSFYVERAFDLDTAVGDQLDILGKYAGIKPVDSYYLPSIDDYVVLTDAQLRQLINIKIATNNTRSTYSEIKRIMYENFPDDFRTVDNKDMTMTILSNLTASEVGQIAVTNKYFPIPACVGYRYYQVESLTNLFSFVSYTNKTSIGPGFGDYSGTVGGYFLSYSDSVTI